MWHVKPFDTRGQIVDFVLRWSDKTEISGRFTDWLDIAASMFYDFLRRKPYCDPPRWKLESASASLSWH